MDEQQPGNVISPRSQDPAQHTKEVVLEIPRTQDVPPTPAPQPMQQATPSPEPVFAEQTPAPVENALPYQQNYEQHVPEPSSATVPINKDGHVSWSASEFIDHAKSLNWYLIVGIVGLVGSIGVYFLTKDIISTAAIAIVAVLFAVSAARKPQVLPYVVNETGIQIGQKHYQYADFKTFGLVHDSSAFSSIHLTPLKRFAPPVSMYFPPDEEDAIANALSIYLPYEERKADATDRLLKKLRF